MSDTTTSLQREYPQLQSLPELPNRIIDKTVDNVTRKLIGGFRNKNNSRPGAKTVDMGAVTQDTLAAVSSQSVMKVANRGVAWKDIITKSITHGISSLSTMQFDGQFTVKNGVVTGLETIPEAPGVYVVYDQNNQVRYVGDAGDLRQRWRDGHLNENRSKLSKGERYKLSDEFENGCTVKFVVMDSVETAAAVEANILRNEPPPVNAKEELKNEQGTRSNIEAKKMKDAFVETGGLALRAGIEAAKNVGWDILEQLISTMIKALKDEIVDVFITTQAALKIRLERFFKRVWQVIQNLIDAPLKVLKGIFEFVINALSQTVSKIYQLAKNIYDLGMAALDLKKAAPQMNKDALITQVSELVIMSGSLIVWDALDPVLEQAMNVYTPFLAPFSPYIAAATCAIGFGVSSYYLCQFVPKVISAIVNFESEFSEKSRATYAQILQNFEQQEALVIASFEYAKTSMELIEQTSEHTQTLNQTSGKLTRFSLEDHFATLK